MRVFVGLTLPDAITEQLSSMCSGIPGARWVAPENQHITLRFVGEVDGGTLEELAIALAEVRAPAFSLSLVGLGKFESARSVRAVWAAVTPQDPVAFLAAKVESAMVRAGLEPEHRKFKPHVTVGRLKDAPQGRVAEWMEQHGDVETPPFAVSEFVLYQSHLTKDGAYYEVLADYPLQEDFAGP